MRRFNPSIEGQPLQLIACCRDMTNISHSFNPSIEGQPLQLSNPVREVIRGLLVSIPLSRDSLCNSLLSSLDKFLSRCFNPSIEGQPLQLKCIPEGIWLSGFNPSIEGQPLQRNERRKHSVSTVCSFNPSIEGQPLQQLQRPKL